MNEVFETPLKVIIMHFFLQIHCQPSSLTPCRSDLQIVGHNCPLTCSVADSTKLTSFFKSGSLVGGCSSSCSPSTNRNNSKNEVYLLLKNMSYSNAGTYSCSHGGSSKEAVIVVDSHMVPNIEVKESVQGLVSISPWCLTNYSRENLKFELQDTNGNVIKDADIRVELENKVACEYPEESAYSMLVQVKKEYCSGQVVYGKRGFSVSVKLRRQEKAIALNYTCKALKPAQVCVCSKKMFLGAVTAAFVMGGIMLVGKKILHKQQWFKPKIRRVKVPKICALYGTIVAMSLVITLIVDFNLVTCNCAVLYGAGIGTSFACDTILFCLLICLCFNGRGKEAVPHQGIEYKPENRPFTSKHEQDVPREQE